MSDECPAELQVKKNSQDISAHEVRIDAIKGSCVDSARRIDGCAEELAKLDTRVIALEGNKAGVKQAYRNALDEINNVVNASLSVFEKRLTELSARNDALNKQNANLKQSLKDKE